MEVFINIAWCVSCQSGIENNEDMQHLDHEIKELNESNLKIEADMMQLQTQVNNISIYFKIVGNEVSQIRPRFSLF